MFHRRTEAGYVFQAVYEKTTISFLMVTCMQVNVVIQLPTELNDFAIMFMTSLQLFK